MSPSSVGSMVIRLSTVRKGRATGPGTDVSRESQRSGLNKNVNDQVTCESDGMMVHEIIENWLNRGESVLGRLVRQTGEPIRWGLSCKE